MHSDKNYDGTTTPKKDLVAPKSASRRRLLRGGAAVAPVALTFISMPVRADLGGVTCRAASAFASITAAAAANAVTSANTSQICTGAKPANWLSANSVGGNWPPGAPPTQLFAFTTVIPPATTTNSPTLVQVLQGTGSGTAAQDRLAKNLVAALLNNKQGLVPDTVVNLSQLQQMWNTVGVGGGNYPVTGISGGWSIIQVNAFLEQTFT
jgi:hypothetical protein